MGAKTVRPAKRNPKKISESVQALLADLPPNSIERELIRIASQVPLSEWKRIPADGSYNLDHYLYGAPKRR